MLTEVLFLYGIKLFVAYTAATLFPKGMRVHFCRVFCKLEEHVLYNSYVPLLVQIDSLLPNGPATLTGVNMLKRLVND